MVHDDEEYVVVLAEAEQPCPEGQIGRQVEDALGLGGEQCGDLLVGRRGDRQLHPDAVGGQDPLVRLPFRLAEDGAQALVASRDIGERGLQGGDVEVPADPDGERNVVRRRGALQLVEEPEPLLGRRERQRFGPFLGRQGRAGGLRAAGGDVLGEQRHGRVLEELPQRQLDVEDGAHPAHQPGRQQ
ncbi:hypothetical protein EES42_16835 [Streptomyces sp. ADI95-17]|nr:hypothetical protein EES42_16835 [Streptomyces sp. ADI95-17]